MAKKTKPTSTFLLAELSNPRPLLPRQLQAQADAAIYSAEVQETLATFNTIAQQPSSAMGAYVISMAKQPSDVLAVMLLQKEAEYYSQCVLCRYLKPSPTSTMPLPV
jgi:phosphoenolpyruvate carboxylase